MLTFFYVFCKNVHCKKMYFTNQPPSDSSAVSSTLSRSGRQYYHVGRPTPESQYVAVDR